MNASSRLPPPGQYTVSALSSLSNAEPVADLVGGDHVEILARQFRERVALDVLGFGREADEERRRLGSARSSRARPARAPATELIVSLVFLIFSPATCCAR